MNAGQECWVVTTGEAGMRSQALGLAEAIGLPFIEKQIVVHRRLEDFFPRWAPASLASIDPAGDRLEPPWPRLLIACGSRSVGPTLAIRQLAGGATRTVYIQDPRVASRHFDLVVPMSHDAIRGPNVLPVQTALHRVTAARLAGAAAEWEVRLRSGFPHLLGVLLGGPTRHHRMESADVRQLIAILRRVRRHTGGRVVLTPSRRTEHWVKKELLAALAAEAWYSQWDGNGPNPFLGLLALSDRLLVSADSVSMISEALAAGTPVHVLPLTGHSSRHETFLTRLVDRRLVSMIRGGHLDWSHESPGAVDATAETAAIVRQRLFPPGS
jgi:mitochondrial fission protein ELM1